MLLMGSMFDLGAPGEGEGGECRSLEWGPRRKLGGAVSPLVGRKNSCG